MKKLLSLLFAVLVSTMVFGQVSVNFDFIGRVDANPRFTFDGEKPTYNWANSCAYTKFEANVDDWFGFTLVNHWLSSDEEEMRFPFSSSADLYHYTGTNTTNWIDYLYLDFMTNGWTFRIGKDCMAMGGFEYDAWDWDCDYDLVSTFWNYNSSYQWGASVAYTTEDESTTLTLQALSSPGDMFADETPITLPWKNGLGSYFFQHVGSYGIVDTRNSIGYIATDKKAGYINGSLGAQINILDNFNVGADVLELYHPQNEFNVFHVLGSACYETENERWEFLGKVGYERIGEDNNVFGGVSAAFFPIKEDKSLRLMGTLAGRTGLKGISLTLGILYDLHFDNN